MENGKMVRKITISESSEKTMELLSKSFDISKSELIDLIFMANGNQEDEFVKESKKNLRKKFYSLTANEYESLLDNLYIRVFRIKRKK